MAITTTRDALRPSSTSHSDDASEGVAFDLTDFEEELRKLSAANQELLDDFQGADVEHHPNSIQSASPLTDSEECAMIRVENASLRIRIEELEAILANAPTQSEGEWLERQTEYETLLEEKSEVIRALHQKLQDSQTPQNTGHEPSMAGTGGVAQAEEILRLKRELDDQRKQMEQDEADMMSQLRQMEMTMARERAEMARQRQDMTRQQADLVREIEIASRDPILRERLHHLRRPDSARSPSAQAPQPVPTVAEPNGSIPPVGRKSSGFFRRVFG